MRAICLSIPNPAFFVKQKLLTYEVFIVNNLVILCLSFFCNLVESNHASD